ncbi:unnamed protein product, partial [Choristocarpus tenellus]
MPTTPTTPLTRWRSSREAQNVLTPITPVTQCLRKARLTSTPKIRTIKAKSGHIPTDRLRLANGVVLGGAWKEMEEQSQEKNWRESRLEEQLRQALEALMMAEEDKRSVMVRLNKERERISGLIDDNAFLRKDHLETKNDLRRLGERYTVAMARLVQLKTERREASGKEEALSARMEETIALCGDLRDGLNAAKLEEDRLCRELSRARSEGVELNKQLKVERSKSSMLSTLRDQKDRHIVILVKEKNRLQDRIITMEASTKGSGASQRCIDCNRRLNTTTSVSSTRTRARTDTKATENTVGWRLRGGNPSRGV